MSDIIERLQTEADLCRNDGAEDIARLLDDAVSFISDVTNKVREIHQVMKRGKATEDHGLDGNLACILDHACSKNDPEPL